MNKPTNTSWEKQGKWYNNLVGDKGHYYHEHIIIPNVIRLLNLQKDSKLIDLGCGQGILARKILQTIFYVGIDLANSLILSAQKLDKNSLHKYYLADATKPLSIKEKDFTPHQNGAGFTHATAILSLQNMERVEEAIKNVSASLKENGKFVIVLNHPCFRIPRQSGWGISENKLQYRYINKYMSFLKIPINMHPGTNKSEITWSYHHPLSYYIEQLKNNGFLIETIEEWVSDKVSVGTASKMENRSRNEIPLFLAISAIKK